MRVLAGSASRAAVLLILVVSALVSVQSPRALAADPGVLVTTPVLDGQVLKDTPRVLEVATDAKVELLDRWGRSIPFTGPERQGSTLFLPSLPPGQYRLVANGESASFEVRLPTFSEGHDGYPLPDAGSPTGGSRSLPVWLLLFLVVPAGGLAVFVAVRGRKGAAVALVALAVVASGLLVVPSAASADEAPSIDDCRVLANGSMDSQVFKDCAFDRMAWVLEHGGLTAAMHEMDAKAMPSCHEIVHQFGVFSWVRLGGAQESLIPGLGACNDAYYHGALYGASTYSTDAEYVDAVRSVCQATADPANPVNGDCYHGVGHGMAMRFGGDTVRARQVCDEVAPPPGLPNAECVGAVYMQHAVRFANAQGDPSFAPDPAVPVQEVCAQETDPEIIGFCYTAIAMAAPREERDVTVRKLMDLCNAEPVDRQALCGSGMAGEFRSLLPGGGVDGARACMQLDLREAVSECVREYSYFVFDQYRDSSLMAPICAEASLPVEVCSTHRGVREQL